MGAKLLACDADHPRRFCHHRTDAPDSRKPVLFPAAFRPIPVFVFRANWKKRSARAHRRGIESVPSTGTGDAARGEKRKGKIGAFPTTPTSALVKQHQINSKRASSLAPPSPLFSWVQTTASGPC